MTLLLLFGNSGGAAPAITNPGGGGLGGPMPDAWFKRYTLEYKSTVKRMPNAWRYTPDYKPTIRKQKG